MKIIEFGRYWKDTESESLPIQWLVLEETDDCFFIVSKQSIVSKAFDKNEKVWANSNIRQWLNREFIGLAFDEYEKPSIVEKEIITTGGEDVLCYREMFCRNESVTTKDKVFLLSVEDVDKYFTTPQSRVAEQSGYAVNTLEDSRKFTNAWWLRNWGVGILGACPILILEDGTYYLDAAPDNLEGIRPAMYIHRDYLERIPIQGQISFEDSIM